MNKKALKLLYKSFDLKLSKKEEEYLNEALNSSEELRAERKRISLMREDFSKGENGSFSPYFTPNVMQKIKDINRGEIKNNFFNILVSDFKVIAATAVIILGILLAYNFIRSDNYYTNNITMDELIEPVAMIEMEDLL